MRRASVGMKRLLKYWATMDKHVDDGGPGSGNWGHKGRPGLVGGSGKGGGKQYRGGRGDIHYHGSRHDWLNGLKGEKQKEASKWLKEISMLFGTGQDDQKTVEGMVMKMKGPSGIKQKTKLLDYLAEARSWPETAQSLIDENWDETDKKVAKALAKKYGFKYTDGLPDDSSGTDKWEQEDLDYWYDLKSKAMGGQTSGKDIPDSLQYAAGLKEDTRFAWVNDDNRRWIQQYLTIASGKLYYKEKPHLPKTNDGLDKMEEAAMQHTFVDEVKMPRDRYDVLDNMANYLRAMGKVQGWNEMTANGVDGIPNLSDEEKNDLAEIIKEGRGKHKLEDFDDSFMISLTYDRNADGQMGKMDLVQRYLYYKAKALGCNPPGDPMAKKNRTEEIRKKVGEQIKADFPRRKGTIDKAFHDKVEGAKNTKQIVQAITDAGYFKANGKVSLGSMDIDNAKSVAHSLNRICNTFTFMKGQLGSLKTASLGNGVMGQCVVSFQGTIFSSPTVVSLNDLALGSSYFKKGGNVVEEYEDDILTQYHPQGTHYDSVITHELGHAIDNYLSSRGVLGGRLSCSLLSSDIKTSHYIKQAVMTRLGGSPDVKQELSRYGAKNDAEWFAECIAEYYSSATPRRMATMCIEELGKALKQEGLEYNDG